MHPRTNFLVLWCELKSEIFLAMLSGHISFNNNLRAFYQSVQWVNVAVRQRGCFRCQDSRERRFRWHTVFLSFLSGHNQTIFLNLPRLVCNNQLLVLRQIRSKDQNKESWSEQENRWFRSLEHFVLCTAELPEQTKSVPLGHFFEPMEIRSYHDSYCTQMMQCNNVKQWQSILFV